MPLLFVVPRIKLLTETDRKKKCRQNSKVPNNAPKLEIPQWWVHSHWESVIKDCDYLVIGFCKCVVVKSICCAACGQS